MQKVSIIIPIYNEKKTLLKILDKVEKAPVLGLKKEIILVDDYSYDGTKEILRGLEKKYTVIYHSKNRGKGQALKTGLERASGDIALVQDADLEYNPQNYPRLLKPILDNETSIVYGSRVLQKNNPKFSLTYYLGGVMISGLTNLLYGSHLTDVPTCYKVFKMPVLKSFDLKSNGFGLETEVTVKALKQKYKILEVPIDYNPRSIKEGKKIRPWHALILIWPILKYRFIK